MGGRGANGSRNNSEDEFDEEMKYDNIRDDYEPKGSQKFEEYQPISQKQLDSFNNRLDKADTLKKLNAVEAEIRKAYNTSQDSRLKTLLDVIRSEKREYT